MIGWLAAVAGTGYAVYRWRQTIRCQRRAFIESYGFPPAIAGKVRKVYPHLDDSQVLQVLEGLRAYFQMCGLAGRRMVAMPSQAVDVAWHEFILFTRNYEIFCRRALGRLLHHTPAEAMKTPTQAQEGIKRAWRLNCHLENIDPKAPARLPALFAMDAALAIGDGFRYALDCKTAAQPGERVIYCGSDIGCAGGCSGDSGGDGGGDGDGGSCGGGCGGGGD